MVKQAAYTIYTLKISTLTPLHIGSGRELLHEYDYAIHGGRTWRINETALLDAVATDDLRQAEQLARTPPAQLINPNEYQEASNFFRYVIKGTPRSRAEGAQVREQLKDSYDRPYLPGSSLKGAFRTALAWYAWGQKKLQPELSKLGRRREWAAQEYEHDIFGPNPNHDLLRALHVTDSAPLGADAKHSAERLAIFNVRVLGPRGGLASPIELEGVRSDSTFELSLKLDRALFGDWAKRHGLQLNGAEWLMNLPAVVNAHTHQRIEREYEWFKGISNAALTASFYQTLRQARLGEGQFLLQLGWGTGWDDKTFGVRLQDDDRFMERIIGDYRLARGNRDLGDPFPKSRRVAVRFEETRGQRVETPAYPLGWVLVEMKAADSQ